MPILRKIFVCVIAVGCFVGYATVCNAREDIFADHKKAMGGKADAHAVTVYDAWGNNMAKRIERGSRGVLVKNGESSAKGVVGDGAGNVTVKKGAKINGPLIIKNDYKNATIIGR